MQLFRLGLLIVLAMSLCSCSLRGLCWPFKGVNSRPLDGQNTISSRNPEPREAEVELLEPVRMDEPIRIIAPDTSQG